MKMNGRRLAIAVVAVVAFFALGLTALAMQLRRHFYHVAAMSMSPTLKIGDGIRVLPLSSPHRQDIVFCDRAWPDSTATSIWRVIGLPGEQIAIKHKKVYVNGQLLPEPYAHFGGDPDPTDSPKNRDDFGPLRLPSGQYFLLGDNRDDANDSRFRGPVTRDRITGLVSLVFVAP